MENNTDLFLSLCLLLVAVTIVVIIEGMGL